MKKHIGWLVPLLLLLFTALAWQTRAGAPAEWELRVYQLVALPMSPALTAALRVVTHLGDPASVAVFCCGLLVFPGLHKTYGVPVAVSASAAAILNQVLKRTFQRERPEILRLVVERGYSFPSGHAMTSAALYLLLALLILHYGQNPRKRALLATLCVCMTVLVGISRVYLGVHHAGDVLAGWALGAAIALTVYAVWERSRQRAGI